MKIGTILVCLAINFFSLSLQNELEIIENVDEEEPKTLDGVPIDEEIPFNKHVRKTPVQKLSDKDDVDDPEADLRKQSKHTKKVHPAESKGKKVDKSIRKKSSKVVEDTDDGNGIKDIDRKKLKDVKRNKKILSINKKPDDEKISANTDVNPRSLIKKKGIFL